MKIKVAQFGLGPIGLETIKLVATKSWAKVVGAIDNSPHKAGRSLADLTGIASFGRAKVHASIEDFLRAQPVDLLFHTTVSQIGPAVEQLIPAARRGVSVVSSCEELLFPALREPRLAARLDALCRRHGARIVGTGVNPGFVMDVLPLCVTGVSRAVQAVHVQRVVNASTRREPLQRKIGSGLPPAEFRRLFRAGQAGHAGLKESLALVAHCLGWKLDGISETGDAVVADHNIQTRFLSVKRGQTCGLHQRAIGKIGGKTRITLDLRMYLDARDPHDAIQVVGDPPLDVLLRGGVAGDQATVAALVNTAPRLLQARPGLLLMTDLSLPRIG